MLMPSAATLWRRLPPAKGGAGRHVMAARGASYLPCLPQGASPLRTTCEGGRGDLLAYYGKKDVCTFHVLGTVGMVVG